MAADPLGFYITILIAGLLLGFEPFADDLGPKKLLLFLVPFFAVLVPSRMLAQAISIGITKRRTRTPTELGTMLRTYVPLAVPLAVPILVLAGATAGLPWKRGSVALALGFWWCIAIIVVLGIGFGLRLNAPTYRRVAATPTTLALCAALVRLRVLMGSFALIRAGELRTWMEVVRAWGCRPGTDVVPSRARGDRRVGSLGRADG